MIENRELQFYKIFQEMDEKNQKYWFDFKRQKFLHNIDTFYYSVKFFNDFTKESQDISVLNVRNAILKEQKKLDEKAFGVSSQIFLDGFSQPLNFTNFSYAGFYQIMLSLPEMFDIFIAPVVPSSSSGGSSVTCEVIVQLRSYFLWMYGTKIAFDKSFYYVELLSNYFGLEIQFTQENRCDFCWHTNYFASPEKFFTPEKFYKMRVDRFKGAFFHTAKTFDSNFEIDYIALGKRSDKVFLRIYLKTKEVIEKGYKDWFFKVWFFNGLISRYDLFVYEKCFMKHSWQYRNMARLEFYLENGSDEVIKDKINALIEKRITMSPAAIQNFADEITPKIHLIMNIEYQVMRKHSKSYCLIPFKSFNNRGINQRVYDFLDNRPLIIDYLTHNVFRLVDNSDDSNKSRADYCSFWKSLRRCKLIDSPVLPAQVHLIREYHRNLSAELMKQRVINSVVTLGIYNKGCNKDSPVKDMSDFLCMLNDNDIHDALFYKSKKLTQLPIEELDKLDRLSVDSNKFVVVDEYGTVITD